MTEEELFSTTTGAQINEHNSMAGSNQLVHLHLQAWNECEAAGENYLNTYAAMRSDDDDSEMEGPEGELFSAKEHPMFMHTRCC